MTEPTRLALRRAPSRPDVLRKPLCAAAMALCYLLTARLLADMGAPPNGAVLTVWLPSGMSVAAMLLFGSWIAIGAYVGTVAFELSVGTPLPATFIVGLANTGCELLCYGIITRGGRTLSIDAVRDVARLGVGACIASLASAFVGVTTYAAFGIVPVADYWPNLATWFGSVTVGVLLITPFLVNVLRRERPMLHREQVVEFIVVIAALCLGAYFWQGPGLSREIGDPMLLVIILGLLWTAYRFSPRAMTAAVFVFAVAAVSATVLRFVNGQPEEAAYVPIFSLQLMLGGLSLIAYALAAMVEQRRQSDLALREAQQEALANARQAGMAEIAANVLHNIGNVLNSVNVSAGVVTARLQASKSRGLGKAVSMLVEHEADLAAFLTQDPRGRLLPAYLAGLDKSLGDERQMIMQELAHLTRNIDHIKDIVATQQSYAGRSAIYELARMSELVEDALRLNGHLMAQGAVKVVRRFADVPRAQLDRARLVQILVNLIGNALQAMAGSIGHRRLTVSIDTADGLVRVQVADEGEGIAPENLTRIFTHGFTTRRGGHGFGLHSCALAARDMGGSLSAHSDGRGRGAVFTLEVPIRQARPVLEGATAKR